MSEGGQGSGIAIVVAVIGVVGTLGTAVIYNSDKIFPKTETETAVTPASSNPADAPPAAAGAVTPPPGPAQPAASPPASLAAPQLQSPPDNAVFGIFPRTTTLAWSPVPGAAQYKVEVTFAASGWTPLKTELTPDTSLTFNFIGAQAGQWRVTAVAADGSSGTAAPWRTFAYTQ